MIITLVVYTGQAGVFGSIHQQCNAHITQTALYEVLLTINTANMILMWCNKSFKFMMSSKFFIRRRQTWLKHCNSSGNDKLQNKLRRMSPNKCDTIGNGKYQYGHQNRYYEYLWNHIRHTALIFQRPIWGFRPHFSKVCLGDCNVDWQPEQSIQPLITKVQQVYIRFHNKYAG